MNLKTTRPQSELIIGSGATIITGAMCYIASVKFVSIYDGFYGADMEFPLVTRIALAAKIWSPILLGVALVFFLRRVTRPPQTRKPLATLIALNLLVMLFVGYGLFAPLRRTTFEMSKPPTPAAKTQ